MYITGGDDADVSGDAGAVELVTSWPAGSGLVNVLA